MTLFQLSRMITAEIANGYGNKTVLVSQDEEGNGFYQLRDYLTVGEDVKDFEDLFDYSCPPAEQCVILG